MATLLARAINFRSLLDQLDKAEYLRLMSKVFDEHKSELIGMALFSYFTQNKADANMNGLQQMNSAISAIIRSRKPIPKKEEVENPKLDKLPPQIIGNIASSLEQNDYFHFEQANRSIFIGCNAPNQLQELDLLRVDNYSCIDLVDPKHYSKMNLSKYQSLRHFGFNISEFHQFQLPNDSTFILNK